MGIKEWCTGAIVHAHFRPSDAKPDWQVSEKQQATLEGALRYAQLLSGEHIIITDTNHAAIDQISDLAAAQRDEHQCFSAAEKSGTILSISESVRQRYLRIKESKNAMVLAGTEADILDATGQLDVTNDVLSDLDIVIASLHYYPWRAGMETNSRIDIQGILKAYQHVVRNPHVDVLGHPTRDIQHYNKSSDQVLQWKTLFDLMRATGVAYEINLNTADISLPENAFDRELIFLAHQMGTKFIIGCDFHNLASFGVPFPASKLIEQSNAELIFNENLGKHTLLFHKLRRFVRTLRNMGLVPTDIVNSSQELFKDWLHQRGSI